MDQFRSEVPPEEPLGQLDQLSINEKCETGRNDSDNEDSIQHVTACDNPSSPADPLAFFKNNNKPSEVNLNTSWFNPPPTISPIVKTLESESKDYAHLQKLLHVNRNSSPPAPIFSSGSPSTSSPWSLPQNDSSLHRPATVSRTPQIHQNIYRNTFATRQTPISDADFIQALRNQLAACQVTQPWGGDTTYIMQQQQQHPQQRNSQQWPQVYQRDAFMDALQAKVDEVTDEFRRLEKERKQTEVELARHNPGKIISSSNSFPIPTLPTASSQIDQLVVDFFREHARITTLLAQMELLTGISMPMGVHQTLAELLHAISSLFHSRVHAGALILQQLRGEMIIDEEKEAGVLIEILCLVQKATTRVRSANWYCLMTTLGPLDVHQRMQMDLILVSKYTIPPPPIRPRRTKLSH